MQAFYALILAIENYSIAINYRPSSLLSSMLTLLRVKNEKYLLERREFFFEGRLSLHDPYIIFLKMTSSSIILTLGGM
jgi:hypothetical protein